MQIISRVVVVVEQDMKGPRLTVTDKTVCGLSVKSTHRVPPTCHPMALTSISNLTGSHGWNTRDRDYLFSGNMVKTY